MDFEGFGLGLDGQVGPLPFLVQSKKPLVFDAHSVMCRFLTDEVSSGWLPGPCCEVFDER